MKSSKYLFLIFASTFTTTVSSQWSYSGDSGSNRWIGTNDYSPFDIRTNSQNRMYILPNGRIGINTSQPAGLLHINGIVGANVRNLTVRCGLPGSTAFSNTEFSALANFPTPTGTLFAALYAKSGNHSSTVAGYFDGRVYVTGGVIQRGGAPITNTADLGLYSLETGYHMRFVTNNAPIRFFTDGGTNPIGGNDALYIESNGSIGIGTINTAGYKLAVNGFIRAKKVVVETSWSDFVFQCDYQLRPLEEVKAFIENNGHLPDIPSEDQIVEYGADVGDLLKLHMQKIEELTLYIIEQNRRINELESQVKH